MGCGCIASLVVFASSGRHPYDLRACQIIQQMLIYRLCRDSPRLKLKPSLILLGATSLAIFRHFSRPLSSCVTRLSYRVPNEAIGAALSPFGKILTIRMSICKGACVGMRNVLMEITTPIPSSFRVVDHWCNLF